MRRGVERSVDDDKKNDMNPQPYPQDFLDRGQIRTHSALTADCYVFCLRGVLEPLVQGAIRENRGKRTTIPWWQIPKSNSKYE